MTTVRVVLTAMEVVEALTRYAYYKTGRDEPVKTGKVETLVMMGDDGKGGSEIKQARIEMELPE